MVQNSISRPVFSENLRARKRPEAKDLKAIKGVKKILKKKKKKHLESVKLEGIGKLNKVSKNFSCNVCSSKMGTRRKKYAQKEKHSGEDKYTLFSTITLSLSSRFEPSLNVSPKRCLAFVRCRHFFDLSRLDHFHV